MEFIVHGSKNQNDSKFYFGASLLWVKSQTTNAWSKSVEADRNVANSLRETHSKVSIKLILSLKEVK